MAEYPQFTQASSSATGTVAQTQTTPSTSLISSSATLVLRAEPAQQRHIQWADDVIDNEGMGKKSSKVCCIYHKPRAIDDSSSDDSSGDSSSDSDSEPDNSQARPVGASKRNGRNQHKHNHDHRGSGDGSNPRAGRKSSPNAYEKMPKQKQKQKTSGPAS